MILKFINNKFVLKKIFKIFEKIINKNIKEIIYVIKKLNLNVIKIQIKILFKKFKKLCLNINCIFFLE